MDAGAMGDTGDYEPYSMDTEKQYTVFSKAPNTQPYSRSIFFLILVHVCCYSLDTLHTLSFTVHVVLV